MRTIGHPHRHDRHYLAALGGAGAHAGHPARPGGVPRRQRAIVLGAIAVAAVVLCCTLLAVPARAGSYNVSICGLSGAAGTGDGLSVTDNAGSDGYMTTANLCSTSGPAISQQASLPSGSLSHTWNGDGSWTLTAPPGLTIQSLTMNRVFSGFGSYFTYELRNAANTLLEGAATYNSYGVPVSGTRTFFNVNSSSVTGRFWCANASGCTGAGTSVTLTGITVTLNDNSSPNFNSAPTGSLFDAAVAGTRSVSFDAYDTGGGSGIYRAELLVDGSPVATMTPDTNGGRCVTPFVYLAPCNPHVTATMSVDTTLIPDGQHQLRLKVYDATNADTVTSAPHTVTVDNTAPSGGVPSLSGTTIDGQQLTADPGAWQGASGNFTYAYLRCDANAANCATVSGASGSTYTLTPADVGSTLRVLVTAYNIAGVTTQATSAATPVIQPQPPAATGLPAIAGTVAVGQPLSSTTGTWTGTPTITFVRQWETCDAFSLCTPVAGATNATYTPSLQDVGDTIVLAVTATNAAGSVVANSTPSVVVPPVAPTSTAAPTISGTPRDRLTLTADDGTFGGSPATITRVWERCNQSACVAIDGATDASYTASAADVGSTLRVAVTATNAAGMLTVETAETAPVAAIPPVALEQPSITGAWTEGIALAGHAGLWDGTPTIAYSYAWSRCDDLGAGCQPLPTATDSSYVPVPEDVDHRLQLTVTALNAAGPVVASSTLTPLIAARAPVNSTAPSIDGAVAVGAPLTASPGGWVGTAPIAFAYVWSTCAPLGGCVEIANATTSTYAPTPADVGHTLQVAVTATNVAGARTAISAATVAVPPVAPTSSRPPAITGAAVDGSTLQANDGTFDGTPTPTITRSWERCDQSGCAAVDGASGTTYTLGPDDIGTTIQLAVTATNAGGQVTVRSAPTAVVAAAAPSVDANPSIIGAGTEGVPLSGVPGLWSGTPQIQDILEWLRCSATGEPASCVEIPGATDANYVPSTADIGHRLRLQVTASNAGGQTTSLSDPTRPILARPPVNDTPPAITGETTDGQTLSASVGEWSGTAEIRTDTTWLRCDASGGECTSVASGSDYELGPDDVGFTMRVRVTATNVADTASALSDPSALVLARAPDSVRAPQIEVPQDAVLALGPPRTVRADATLSVTGDLWDGTGTLDTTITWERCTTATAQTCQRIQNANTRTYALDAADAGAAVRAEVLAVDDAGTAHAFTPPVLVERPAAPAAPSAPAPPPAGATQPSTPVPRSRVATQLRVGEPVTICRPLLRRMFDAGPGALRADGSLTGTTRVRAGQRTLLTIVVHGDTVIVEQGARRIGSASGVTGLRWTQRGGDQLVLQSDRLLLAIGRNPHHPSLVVAKGRLCTTSTPAQKRVSALANEQIQLAITLTTSSGQALPRATVRLDDGAHSTVRTDRDGVATMQLRAAGSRRVHITFAGDTGHASATLDLPVDVAATTTLALVSGSIPATGPVDLLGRLQGAGDATGTRIHLSYKAPDGRWRTVGTARADAHGRWHLTTSRPATRPGQTLVLYQATIQPGPRFPYQARADVPASFHLANRSKP